MKRLPLSAGSASQIFKGGGRRRLAAIVGLLLFAAVAVLLWAGRPAQAATCTWTGATSTNWADAGNWSGCGGVTPRPADTAVINSAANQPTLSSDVAVAALTLNSGTTLTVSSGATLTVNGNITLNADGGAATTLSNSGTVTQSSGTTTLSRTAVAGTANINLSGAGTWNLNNLTTGTSTTNYNLANNATYTIAGNITRTAGTFVPGTSTVVMMGSGKQLAGAGAHTYYNLTVNSGASVTNQSGAGNLTIQKDLTVSGSFAQDTSRTITFDNASAAHSLSGGGSITFGNVTVQGGTTLNAGSQNFSVVGASFEVNSVGGTFNGGTATVTFSGTTAQTVGGGGTRSFNNLTVNNAAGVTLNAHTTAGGTVTITSGALDQGATANLSAEAISVASGATLKNLGVGDLTLGAGGVSNSGTVNYNGGGTPCADADSILIRSSAAGTQRTWSGPGTFSFTDVDARDQKVPGGLNPPAAIIANSSTDSGNNAGWTFTNDSACTAGTYTWVGGLSADWQQPTSWSPARLAPNPADVLIFDGGVTPAPAVSNVPTQTVAALRLTNGADVALKASTVAAPQTLTLAGATGSDLLVPSGGRLTLSDSSALRINLSSGSAGTVGGGMTFEGGAHRLIGNAAGALTFQGGAIFGTAADFTGNPFGTGASGDGAAGSVVFADDSDYFHNAGESPFGGEGSGPVVLFQTGSRATWLTASGFQASGRTYADLIVGKEDPGGVAVSLSAGGPGNFQFDNLRVNSTSTANSSFSYAGTGASAVTVRGDIISAGAGGGGTLPDVTLSGGAGGVVISKPGGIVTFGNVWNMRSVLFESNSKVAAGTTLSLGRLLIAGLNASNNYVVAVEGALAGSSTGYVIGLLRKQVSGTGTNLFEVGSANGYSPATLDVTSNSNGSATPFTVSAANSYMTGVADHTKAVKRTYTLSDGGEPRSITANVTFRYVAGAPPAGDVSAGVNMNTLDAYRRDGSGNIVKFLASSRGTNTVTVNGVSGFSDWTLANAGAAPTLARLQSFRATAFEGGALLEWRTAYELDNLGFNLYRQAGGRLLKLNPSLVAGSALAAGPGLALTAGNSYAWLDEGGGAGARYWLEDVDVNGRSTMTGPFAPPEAGREAKDARRSPLVNQIGVAAGPREGAGVREWPSDSRPAEKSSQAAGAAAVTRGALERQRELARGAAVKLLVRGNGWYRVPRAQLLAAGLSPSADPWALRLYAEGFKVPLKVSKGDWETEGAVEFYGTGLDAPSTDARVYWLVERRHEGARPVVPCPPSPGGPTGEETATAGGRKAAHAAPHARTPCAGEPSNPPSAQGHAAAPRSSESPESFAHTVERRDRTLYFASVLNGDEENFFGRFVGSTPDTQVLAARNLSRPGVTAGRLEVSLQGVTTGAHNVKVTFNGTELGVMRFSGRTKHTASFEVGGWLLREGDNHVRLASGAANDASFTDYLRLTYHHAYRADDDRLHFRVPGGARPVSVAGFTTPDVRVVDVTDPDGAVELPAKVTHATASEGGGWAVSVPPSHEARTLYAFADARASWVAAAVANEPSNLTAMTGADLVIITNGEFRRQVEPLAARRAAEGLSVAVVDVEDLFDEFSYGRHTPQAVRDFLAWAHVRWSQLPRYVLLVGDGSYDPRGHLGGGAFDLLPSKLVDAGTVETASDDWFADFDGDGSADLAIGRLPVRTRAEAEAVVGKIVGHVPGASDPSVLLVADRNGPDGYNFEYATELLPPLLPAGVGVSRVYRGARAASAVKSQIIAGVNAGPLVVNWMGHGSVDVWTGEGLLSSADAAALTNGGRLPLFVLMTCLNGYYVGPVQESLAEALLKAEGGGALAVWASTGLTEPEAQTRVNRELYRALFAEPGVRLGDAVRRAKAATSDGDVRRTWVLFGDPSARLRR